MTDLSRISIQYLKGVGPARKKLFANLGVETVEDLLYLFPRRYEDRRKLTPISRVRVGEWQTMAGMVLAKGARRTFYNKKHVFELIVGDETSRIFCVWFNQPYLEKYFSTGNRIVLHGRVEVFKNRMQMVCPEYEVIEARDEQLNMGRVVPVYPLTRGITQRYLRRVMDGCLKKYAADVDEVIPSVILDRQGLGLLSRSIRNIHFPENEEAQDAALRRISFEEFFLFQVSVMLRRRSIVEKKGFSHAVPPGFLEEFERGFPFILTRSQKKVIREVIADMQGGRPMLRLLQGDVGSGKTVVAFFGCLLACANGRQAAVMAPTEILAEQHYAAFASFFGTRHRGGMPIRTAFLNSSLKKKDRLAVRKAIKDGDVDVVFGTHALLEEDVDFSRLSFVVVDEQHKFGVKQRAVLSAKGENPDVLVMTATPIPRTLCLTLYGDLDVSVINEKPKGWGGIRTYYFSGEQADNVYKKIAELVAKGTQAYIVYPIIEESEKLDLKAATDMFERLRTQEFKGLRVGIIHGRLPRRETNGIMAKFKAHEIDILVTTTVLEVGIDVPNANVMLIEHAERFGLSQLHQLRGRVGRGRKNAVCILMGDPETEDGKKRIDAVVKTADGFKIAEEDLNIRGPGQYFGRHQHGLNELRVVNPLTQKDVLEVARQEAVALLRSDPILALSGHRRIQEVIRKRYPEYLERTLAG